MNAFELTYNINNNTQGEITTTTLLIVNLPRVWIPKGKRSFLWYRLNSRQLKCSQTTQCYIWRGGLGAIKEQSWLLISLLMLTTTFHLLSPGPGLKGCQWIWRQIHFCLPSENLSVNPFPRNQELQGLPRKFDMFPQVLQRPAQNRGWRSRKAIYPLQVAARVMFPSHHHHWHCFYRHRYYYCQHFHFDFHHKNTNRSVGPLKVARFEDFPGSRKQ